MKARPRPHDLGCGIIFELSCLACQKAFMDDEERWDEVPPDLFAKWAGMNPKYGKRLALMAGKNISEDRAG